MRNLFTNTEIAFRSKSKKQLYQAYWLFRLMGFHELTKIGTYFIKTALKVPLGLKKVIKGTLYQQFCGGETLAECEKTVKELFQYHVYSIPDYVAEGQETTAAYDLAEAQILETITLGKQEPAVGFAVFKVTGLGPIALLEKRQQKLPFSETEKSQWALLEKRVQKLTAAAAQANLRVLIDAEESWIQEAIDELAAAEMLKYNTSAAIVFHTCQMYRHDMPQRLKALAEWGKKHGVVVGVKLVRGAYLEKENDRAIKEKRQSPIWPSKAATDKAYNEALLFCLQEKIALCIGTHNEESVEEAIRLMKQLHLLKNTEQVWFAQLYGMSDHLTFNLADQGYRAAKYLPFGPMELSLPYLFRRANENKAVSGQSSRELELIDKEIQRRKNKQA